MACIWVTGLSGAGKSTVSKCLVPLLQRSGESTIFLDGDKLREIFDAADIGPENHSRSGRLHLAMQYAKLCRLLSEQKITVVIATISMFNEVHVWNRSFIPDYFEVYLQVPIDELRRRDPKLLYQRFYAGQISDVAGLDIVVDEPVEAHFVHRFDDNSGPESIADSIFRAYSKGIT